MRCLTKKILLIGNYLSFGKYVSEIPAEWSFLKDIIKIYFKATSSEDVI